MTGYTDPVDIARVVNARHQAGRILADYRAGADAPRDPLDALSRRCEALEAACYHLFRLVDDADSRARDALERTGA